MLVLLEGKPEGYEVMNSFVDKVPVVERCGLQGVGGTRLDKPDRSLMHALIVALSIWLFAFGEIDLIDRMDVQIVVQFFHSICPWIIQRLSIFRVSSRPYDSIRSITIANFTRAG